MNTCIRILVADDHAITRIGISSLLETESGFEVVGQAEDGEAALREAIRTRPDVIIMDLMMPKMDGLEATRQILRELPETKILILTTFGGADSIAHALDAGAAGAVMKNTDTSRFTDVIREVAAGRRVVDAEIEKMLSDNPPIPALTTRQKEILFSMTRGLSNKEIACQFEITPDCVKDHVNVILAKLGAATRAEAVAIALRKHLLKIQA